jgi:hypothetical protein
VSQPTERLLLGFAIFCIVLGAAIVFYSVLQWRGIISGKSENSFTGPVLLLSGSGLLLRSKRRARK